MCNITVFWLWSLLLLYYGARHALGGKMWSATLIILIWIAAVPLVTVVVSEPVTTVSPRITESETSDQSSGSDSNSGTTTTTTTMPGMDMGGSASGNFGGAPPSGGPSSGSGRP